MDCKWYALVVFAVAAGVGILCKFPRHTLQENLALTEAFDQVKRDLGHRGMLVMSFNIRIDAEERDPNNHYTKRVHRLSAFINRQEPWLVGLQEPSSGQLLHLQSGLGSHMKVIGYDGNGHGSIDRADPRRFQDFQTGILYDSRHLELSESDHLWLSRNPLTPGSKDWGSVGSRTVTIAAFRLKRATDVRIVHLNTHLDVWAVEARVQQAKLLLQNARKWSKRHPKAFVLITGDFNTANGHSPHRLLLEGGFNDMWNVCHGVGATACFSHTFASTFHGWLGSFVNTYMGRVIQFAVQSVHGCGVDFPKAVPGTLREVWRTCMHIAKQLNFRKLWKNMPASLSRMHVDWLLFRQPLEGIEWQPRSIIVAEVRDSELSSDHFPVMGLLSMPSAN